MKMKLILSAALIAGVISANAVTAPVAASVGTNASPEATMKALSATPSSSRRRVLTSSRVNWIRC